MSATGRPGEREAARIARLSTREGQDRKHGRAWHRDWDACTGCGRTTRPHHSAGRCTDCARGAGPASPGAMLTCAQAGALAGLSAASIRRYARLGLLPATEGGPGTGWRVRRDDLLRWLAARSVPEGHKHCPGCERLKPVRQFSRDRSRPDGYDPRCKRCRRPEKAAAAARWRANHPDRYAANLTAQRGRYQGPYVPSEERRRYARRYRARNRERINAAKRAVYAANVEYFREQARRRRAAVAEKRSVR